MNFGAGCLRISTLLIADLTRYHTKIKIMTHYYAYYILEINK